MKHCVFLRYMLLTLLVSMFGFGKAAAQQAYAQYTESNATLTFKYDSNYLTGQTYQLNSGKTDPGWYTDETYKKIERVVFETSFASVRPTSTYRWFYYMEKLNEIVGLDNFNTSEVTNMDWMFSHCSMTDFRDLTLDTKKVTSMRYMFAYSGNEVLGLNFNTSNVTDMSGMFAQCKQLKVADLSTFNTGKVVNTDDMFRLDGALTTVYVGEGWNMSKVTDSEDMFYECWKLVGGAGTTYQYNVTDKTYARADGTETPGYLTLNDQYAVYESSKNQLTFYCDANNTEHSGKKYYLNRVGGDEAWNGDGIGQLVKYVVFDPSFAAARPTSMIRWFQGMERLEYITGMVEYLDISNVSNLSFMFYKCSSLKTIDLSLFNTSEVTDMMYMFYGCSSLKTIYVGNGWDTSSVREYGFERMFEGCTSLVGGQGTTYDAAHGGDYAHADEGTSNPGYLTLGAPYAVFNASALTFYCDANRSERLGKTYSLNVGQNDPGWYQDRSTNSISYVKFDPSFATVRPTTTYGWFGNMGSLLTITGMKEYLNTSEVTDMKRMFSSCASLQMLDLTSFNTAKVTDMSEMFSNCNEMTALDLSSFDTHNVTTMHAMFFRCAGLKTIYVGDGWSPQGASQMFEGCISLVGGEGTTYDSSHTGYDYAHVDGGTDNPGYLSVKKPYVVYNNGTLKFCFDMYRDTCPGTTYDLNNGSGSIMTEWYTDGSYKNVTSVVFDPSFADARPTTTGGWFMEMSKLSSITGMKEYLNTSEVEGATLMFYGCSSLESLDLSNFDTQKMTIMNSMFNGCSGLTSLDLSSFNTAKVTDMGYMFNACSNLKTILIGEGWSTESVRTSYLMFNGCTSLVGGAGTAYDAEHTDAAYAKADGGQSDPGYLTRLAAYTEYADGTLTFYFDGKRGQRSGQTYDLNRYTPKWFSDGTYKNVTSVVFDASFKEACPVSTREWFESMSNLESITGMTEYLNTSEVTDMAGMFFGCQKLTTLDLSNFDTQQVTEMSSMFGGCSALTTIYVSDKWSTASVTSSYYMFYSCDNLVGGAGTTYDEAHIGADYAHVDGGADNPGYLTFKASLKGDVNLDGQVGIGDIVAITNVMAGIETNSAVVARADVNGDDQVGIGDIVAITNIMAGIE